MPIPHSILYALALAAAGAALILAGFWLGSHRHRWRRLISRFQPAALDMEQLFALYDAHLYDRALALCDQALASRPDDPEALFHRGLSLVQMERYDEALAAFAALSLRHPDDLRALHQLAFCLFRSNLSHGALAYMDYVAGQAPDDVGFALSRADVLSDLGRQQDALSLFSSVSVPNEKDAQIAAAWGMATCYARQEQYDQAAAQYRSALALGCDDPECRLLLSQILKQGGKDDEALEATLKQILLTPDFGPCYAQAARLLLDAGDPAQALSYLEQAAARMDDPLHYEKARCLAALGRKGEALAALERLIGQQSDGLREYLRQQGEKDFPSLWGDPQFDRLIHIGYPL